MAAKKGPLKLYRYSAEFKLKAIKLVHERGVWGHRTLFCLGSDGNVLGIYAEV